MKELFSAIQGNLSFVLICIGVVIAVSLLAKLAEHFLPERRKLTTARRVSIVGICAAIATILHILDFPLLVIAPSFYKLDFSELPVMLCGFFVGPAATVACEGIKILLKLLLKGTSTLFVGDFANFIVGCSFVLPASVIYHIHKTKGSAIVGLIIGGICMTIFGSAFNAVYLLPRFAELYHMPLEAIVGLGTEIHPAINSVSTFVMLCVAPLNLVKSIAISVLTMLLYKRVAKPLFGIIK